MPTDIENVCFGVTGNDLPTVKTALLPPRGHMAGYARSANDPNWTPSELTDGAAFDEPRVPGPSLSRIFCDKIA
jgi:hypothetical protein